MMLLKITGHQKNLQPDLLILNGILLMVKKYKHVVFKNVNTMNLLKTLINQILIMLIKLKMLQVILITGVD